MKASDYAALNGLALISLIFVQSLDLMFGGNDVSLVDQNLQKGLF